MICTAAQRCRGFLFDTGISFLLRKPLSERYHYHSPHEVTSRNAVPKLNVTLANEKIQPFGFLLNPFCHQLL